MGSLLGGSLKNPGKKLLERCNFTEDYIIGEEGTNKHQKKRHQGVSTRQQKGSSTAEPTLFKKEVGAERIVWKEGEKKREGGFLRKPADKSTAGAERRTENTLQGGNAGLTRRRTPTTRPNQKWGESSRERGALFGWEGGGRGGVTGKRGGSHCPGGGGPHSTNGNF